ncbi:MAG TPA: hypothetical protein ENK04_12225 [Gammaproteobacteria bacterium]|nr:hypothetical protein [Gammaproteobacteria bacterium]
MGKGNEVRFGKTVRNIILGYLIFAGVLAHIAVLVGMVLVLRQFQLTPSQLMVKLVERSGLDTPWVIGVLSPRPRYADHVLDGRIRPAHPRILLPQLSDWDGSGMPATLRQRAALYESQGMLTFDACKGGGVMGRAACWVNTGNESIAAQLTDKLSAFTLQTPSVVARFGTQYGNGWQLALAYDLLATYPALADSDRREIEAKIEYTLQDYLRVLDDDSPSLWHGRTSLAAAAWLCAVALDPHTAERERLLARAQGHFLDVIRALELTEAWPEGYSYWIRTRALLVVLAAAAYLNGLEDAQHQERIRTVLHRLGLWQILATRPDGRVEGFGDEGAHVNLRYESRPVMDLIAQLTREPVFAAFSRDLERLHGVDSYHPRHRWAFSLFNDPTLVSRGDSAGGVAAMEGRLPQAAMFGQGALNLAYIRSGWSPDATFISYKAGHSFTHHGHYDAGHFTLFKGAPLAINSSTYGEYTGPNRLHYSIRTVAKNSLLILRPGEKVRPNDFFPDNVADGGQRIVMPTGSALQSTQHWQDNINSGLHLEGAELLRFDHSADDYTYVATDLTRAYNTPTYDDGGSGGKVEKVQRTLVYMHKEDRLLIYDQIVSTEAGFTKKWLLHTVNRPDVADLVVLKGGADNGILESRADNALVRNEQSYLRVKRLYPKDAVIRVVGGPDYQFYVETDGDDSELDGENFNQGVSKKPWYDVGMWRMEIQPGADRKEDDFLVVLSPGLGHERDDVVQALSIEGDAKGVVSNDAITVFPQRAGHGRLVFEVPGRQKKLYLFGLPDKQPVTVTAQGVQWEERSNASGVAVFSLPAAIAGERPKVVILW